MADRSELLATIEFLIEMLTIWAAVKEYAASQDTFVPANNAAEHRNNKRTLVDTETFAIALLLLKRKLNGGSPYTLRALAREIEYDDPSLQKSAEGRIKRILDRAGTYYGMIDHTQVPNPRDGQDCYQIEASEALVRFLIDHLHPDLVEKISSMSPLILPKSSNVTEEGDHDTLH